MKRYQRTLTLVAAAAVVAAVVLLISRRHLPRTATHRQATRAVARQRPRTPETTASVAPAASRALRPLAVTDNPEFDAMTNDVALAITTSPSVQLSRAEKSALEHEFIILTYERMLLEQKLASEETAPTGETLIHIPEYKAEGDALYSAFTTAVTDLIGTDRAREFISLNIRDIMLQNNGLGQHAQTILVRLNPDNGAYHIVHSTQLSSKTLGIAGSDTVPRTSISDLRPGNLSFYTYLQPLLPQ